MPFKLLDFHCHLDLYPDFEAVLALSEKNKIFTLAVTTTPMAWPRNRDLTSDKRYVRAALGLHPQLAVDHADKISIWETYLPEAHYIGEVGVDGSPNFANSLPEQIKIFRHVLKCCAEIGGRILTVHTLGAVKIALDLIESEFPRGRGKIVLHWFTGTKAEALRAVDLGCYFSVNLSMLNTKKGHNLLAVIPIERILTETDGPFAMVEDRPARPSDVESVVHLLSKIRKVGFNIIENNIFANLQTLLNSDGKKAN